MVGRQSHSLRDCGKSCTVYGIDSDAVSPTQQYPTNTPLLPICQRWSDYWQQHGGPLSDYDKL